jgi:hypothetical protein
MQAASTRFSASFRLRLSQSARQTPLLLMTGFIRAQMTELNNQLIQAHLPETGQHAS